jgi:glucosyl-3-phosphoglycerate synthase
MSDFFQHGMISTLHRLVDGGIADQHESLSPFGSVVLILPCHYAEIRTAALEGIVRILDEAKFLSRVVISMNGIPDHLTEEVKRFWSRLQKPPVVLWNDSPTLLRQLANQRLHFDPGKGLNLWLAFGWLATNQFRERS